MLTSAVSPLASSSAEHQYWTITQHCHPYSSTPNMPCFDLHSFGGDSVLMTIPRKCWTLNSWYSTQVRRWVTRSTLTHQIPRLFEKGWLVTGKTLKLISRSKQQCLTCVPACTAHVAGVFLHRSVWWLQGIFFFFFVAETDCWNGVNERRVQQK